MGELLNEKPLKLAVVVPVDYYEEAATNILIGVADAQDDFNKKGGKDGRLLEIVIANDGNEPEVSERVANDLSNQEDILGIIGHHASESSEAALDIYEKNKVAIVSPTSSSSKLSNKVFFRTVRSTQVAAKKYADYIKHDLQLNEVVIFYNKDSLYSKTLTEDFAKAFEDEGGKVVDKPSLIDINLDIKEEIQETVNKNVKVVLLIPSVKTNSVARAIAKKNDSLPSTQKLQLLGSMALSNKETIEKGGSAVEGMILASPCLVTEGSDHILKAKERWQQKEIDWRTATAYDATQAFIEAIRRSKEPTREEILKQLKTLTLHPNKTSGFGLKWDSGHSNINRGYCLFEIRDGEFKEIVKDNQ